MSDHSSDDAGLRATTLRRIVTGRDSSGRSIVVADGPACRQVGFVTAPGLRLAEMWSTLPNAEVGRDMPDPTVTQESFVPVPGGSMFRVFEEPPGQLDGLPAGTSLTDFLEEAKKVVPGLAESLEIDCPGMHTTDSIDYVVVLRGKGALELDDGVRVELRPGDCVVQVGTRHRWHNTGAEPFLAVAVMVGARRLP